MSDKQLLEQVAAVAGAVVVARLWAKHSVSRGSDPDRGAALWARGLLIGIVLVILSGFISATVVGFVVMALVILALPALFIMMRFTPPDKRVELWRMPDGTIVKVRKDH